MSRRERERHKKLCISWRREQAFRFAFFFLCGFEESNWNEGHKFPRIGCISGGQQASKAARQRGTMGEFILHLHGVKNLLLPACDWMTLFRANTTGGGIKVPLPEGRKGRQRRNCEQQHSGVSQTQRERAELLASAWLLARSFIVLFLPSFRQTLQDNFIIAWDSLGHDGIHR